MSIFLCNYYIFCATNRYKKNDEHQQQFLEDLVYKVCKGYKTFVSTCENIWLQRLMLCQCPCILFFSWFSLVEEMFRTMVKKTMDHHFLSNFASTTIIFASFDLRMFCGGVDIFVPIINFLNDNRV